MSKLPKCKCGEDVNPGHYIEFMDRLHVVMQIIDEHLVDHPVACLHEDQKKALEQVAHDLMQCYQAAGADNVFSEL